MFAAVSFIVSVDTSNSLLSSSTSKVENIDGRILGKDGTHEAVSFASILNDNTSKKTVKIVELTNDKNVEDDSDSEEVNVLLEDNGKPIDGLVDDARKKVVAPPKKNPRKTSIWMEMARYLRLGLVDIDGKILILDLMDHFGCMPTVLDSIFCHQCTCESCGNGAHYGYNYPPKVSIISNPEPCHNQNINEFPQTLPSFHPKCYSRDENSFAYDSSPNFVDDSLNVFNPPSQPSTYSYEFFGNDAPYGHDCPPQVPFIYNTKPCYNQDFNFPQNFQSFQQSWLQQQQDHVVNIDSYSPEPSQCRKIPIYYDDDDEEESSTPLRYIIIFEHPSCIAITPVLSTEEPKDSLIMGDEHLDTIPKKESDEFIKSSVKNLVLNPSESEDLSNIRSECDVLVCDDFMTFYNLVFDVDDYFSSRDDKSFSDEDVSKEIYSNPLFDEEIISIKIDPHHFNAESDLIKSLLIQDSLIISSSNIDSLLDEFAGELIFLKSIPPGIDEVDCDHEEEIRLINKLLYDNSSPRPLKEFNSENSDVVIESFSPSPILVEDSDSLIEEIDLSLTLDDSMPPGIENDDYEYKGISFSLKDCLAMIPFHFLKMSHFILKFHHPLLSSEIPMMIYGGNIPILDVLFLHFYSLDKLKIAWILKTRAHGFVLRSLDLHILTFNLGIQYPNLID
uniref:Reverse transcriptase domain-containing protein n=1 Tax=Tanacetum cinerariifolium TaxID=118510 RepID=A0A699GI23_TANCI|nr:hypothetical protein [Tanacetum cinerariifolium]